MLSYSIAPSLEELHGTSAGPECQSYASGYSLWSKQRGLHENHRVDPAEPAKDPENFSFVEFSLLPRSTCTVGIYAEGIVSCDQDSPPPNALQQSSSTDGLTIDVQVVIPTQGA